MAGSLDLRREELSIHVVGGGQNFGTWVKLSKRLHCYKKPLIFAQVCHSESGVGTPDR